MNCISCAVEIPPTFVNALRNNSCPSCGEIIMSDDSKSLMIELGEIFKKMPNHPEGIAAWILSNFEVRKKGTEPLEPSVFYNKPEKNQPLKSAGNKIESSNQFLERAGAKNAINENWAELLKNVQSINEEVVGPEISETQYEPEPEQELSMDEQKEILRAEAKKRGRKLTNHEAYQILNAPGEVYVDEQGESSIKLIEPSNDPGVNLLAQMVNNIPLAGNINENSPVVQAERMKRLQRQYRGSSKNKPIQRAE